MTEFSLAKRHFAASPVQLKPIRDFVREIGQQQQLPHTTIEEMVIGVNEACMNIIQHGYQGNTNGEINIEILTGHDSIIFRIIDDAPAVDPASLVPRDLAALRPGGLGVHFIHSVMNEVEYLDTDSPEGNILVLRKNIGKKE